MQWDANWERMLELDKLVGQGSGVRDQAAFQTRLVPLFREKRFAKTGRIFQNMGLDQRP